jgi:hypothetical protein
MANSITPPPELIGRWEEDWHHSKVKHIELEDHIANEAAQWGAKEEFEACYAWIENYHGTEAADSMQEGRHKVPSLKGQALQLLETYNTSGVMLTADQADTIRRALEAPND